MFEIKNEFFGKFKQYILTNKNTNEYASIIPEFGATINQITLSKNNHLHKLIDGCNTYEELITEGRNKFKGCILFPYPNRIENGKYTFEEKEYQLPINFPNENNSIHGLVCETAFNIIKQEANNEHCYLTIRHETTGNDKGYPFKSNIVVDYILNKSGFSITTTITNTDNKNIPAAIGWHPYFKTGSKVDDLYITLPVEYSFEVNNKMIPTGNTIELKSFTAKQKIESHFFDTGFKIKEDISVAKIIIEDKQKDIQLNIWQQCNQNQYRYLQVYTPPHRNSIAIEPMSALANAFNNKAGLIILAPGKSVSMEFGVKLS